MLGTFVYTLSDIMAVGAMGGLALGFWTLYVAEILRNWARRRKL